MPATKNFRLYLTCALSVVCMGWIGSSFSQPLAFRSQAERVRVVPVATVVAKKGEKDVDFLLRRGKLFRAFTSSTGFEACAQICRADDGRMGLSVYTSQAHIGCLVINQCPPGMVETGETVHSHPQNRIFSTNNADQAFLRARPPGANIKRRDRRPVAANTSFSDTDYDSGPGYLIHGNTLWHQAGIGTARQVGTIPLSED